jgi:hypothetical protein
MKLRITFAVIFVVLSAKAIAPCEMSFVIEKPQPIDYYERLMQAILLVESAGDTMAFNAVEEAYGPFQIRPIRIADYNKRAGKNYSMKDCYSLGVSREVFLYYATRIGTDYETIAKRWNGSGVMTIDYWARVRKILDKQTRGSFTKPFT